VPARPFARLQKHVEQQLALAVAHQREHVELGDHVPIKERDPWITTERRPLGEVFAQVDETAIAAASLAQVHRARLLDGTDVVIKVQYPEARRLFPIDLGSLRRAVRVARLLNRDLDLRPLADELAHFVTLELDFTREVRSTQRARQNLLADPPWDSRVVVPKVYPEFSTGKLIVSSFLAGTPLTRAEEMRERGVDLRDVARRIAELYARMIFTHGFFHGDPHPGNIFVLDDPGKLGLLDFGLAKELPAGFAANAAKMIAAGMAGDHARAVEAAREIGFVVSDERAPQLIVLIRALLGDYERAGDLLKQLAPGELEIPHHFTLIGRVMIILSGVSHRLVPNERLIGAALLAALAPHMMAARAS
jgi:ubiquinone biosynthesis protein